MAAPRKYSDAQRQAMMRLYEVGKVPAEIGALCEEGKAGVAPFKIPRRTVHEIVTRMAAEAEVELPSNLTDAASVEAISRFPARVARILDAEIGRLERRSQGRGLTVDDYARLHKAAEISTRLSKRLSQGGSTARRGGNTRESATRARQPESAIEKLAREQRERGGEEVQPSRAHSRQPRVDPRPNGASPAPAAASRGVPAPADAIEVALARRTPAERAEIAQKAKAALGG